MLIIGERINGTRKRIGQAILARDREHIQQEARAQVAAGADFVDVNAGTQPDREPEDLAWLVSTVQAAVDAPLCLDSPNPAALEAGLAAHRGRALVNSVTAEEARARSVLPLIRRFGAQVIGLTMDDRGMPSTAQARLEIARAIVAQAAACGIAPGDVLIDPLVRPVSSEPEQPAAVLEATAQIRASLPEVRVVYGLSNISHGLPNRRLLNQTFLAMGLAAGLQAALLDPLDTELMAVLRAAEALLGQDEFCLNYIAAHREGRLHA